MTVTARVFKSGNSQAIRLPKEFRVNCTELEIFYYGDDIVLRVPSTKPKTLEDAFSLLSSLEFDDEVLEELSKRNNQSQERESF